MIEPPWLPVAPRMTRRGVSAGMVFAFQVLVVLRMDVSKVDEDMDDFR